MIPAAHPVATAERGLAAAGHGLRWLADHPVAPGPLLPRADDAWFDQMLLLRHGDRPWYGSRGRADQLDRTLAALLDEDPLARLDRPPGPAGAGGWAGWAEDLLGAAMVAHLGSLRQPGTPALSRYLAAVREVLRARSGALAAVPPLPAFCLAYNLHELDVPVPAELRCPDGEAAVVRGLAGPERMLTAAYYHTHVVLFAFGAFRRTPADLAPLAASLRFIRAHAAAVAGYGWADLCAEFAICLSLTGSGAGEFRRLADTLLRLQRADGGWSHPRCDERQNRHAATMAVLALLEAAPAADRPVPAGPVSAGPAGPARVR